MTVRKFVQAYVYPYRKAQNPYLKDDPEQNGRGEGGVYRQFAVLAFNLHVNGVGSGDRLFPSTNPGHPNLSGPWLANVKKTEGHPEAQLAQVAHGKIGQYYETFGALPQSVCLFTALSPCRDCLEWLQALPSMSLNRQVTERLGRFVFPKIWVLSFDKYYVATAEDLADDLVYRSQDLNTWHFRFGNRRTAKGTVEDLQRSNWMIEWP